MVNWQSPQEILKDSDIFLKIIYVLFGVYLWELFTTWSFEWSLIVGRRKFRWPLYVLASRLSLALSFGIDIVVFFLCRYCMLLAFIGLIVAYSVKSKIDCNALYTFNSWTGNMSILCASTSLMIRTLVLWERKWAVVVPIVVLCLVHWGLLYRGMFIVHAAWSDAAQTCVVTSTQPELLKINFFFTMGFDLVILVATAVALMRLSARTGLWQLLLKDGLVYFLVSFTANSVPAILNIINLNPVMNVIATVPAATISVIAACRAVIRLLEFNGPEVFVQTHAISQGQVRTTTRPPRYTATRPEVHVTTEAITVAEFPPDHEQEEGDWTMRQKSESRSSMDFALGPTKKDASFRRSPASDSLV